MLHGVTMCYHHAQVKFKGILQIPPKKNHPEHPRAVHDPERLDWHFRCVVALAAYGMTQASQGDAECLGRASAVTWRMVPMVPIVPAESDVI